MITESHKNSIRSSLLITERHLHEIKRRLASESASETILYNEIDDIAPKARQRMIKIINAMLKEIKEMKEDFVIEVTDDELRKYVLASLSEIWVVLEEITPSRLKAFGKVSEEESAAVEPRVSKLLGLLDELAKTLQDR